MKKMIGFALWLVAFLIPFRYAILDTDDLMQVDGTVNNMKGLLNFILLLALLFGGYALVDSANKQASSEDHAH